MTGSIWYWVLLIEFINFFSTNVLWEITKMGKSKLKKDLMRYWVQLLKLNKIDRLRINVDERKITRDNTESLLKDLGNGILDGHEFKNGHKNIAKYIV